MKRYLAVDCGGTKVLAVMYDENFRPIAACKTGSLRDNTTSEDMIKQNFKALANAFGLSKENITSFDELHGNAYENLIEKLSDYCTFSKLDLCGEIDSGLYAAEIFSDGYLALAGTGGTLFAKYNGEKYHNGGYGAAVYDEGCGYGIGRRAFMAAIEDYDGIGPKTMLTELIAEHFGKTRSELEKAIPSIYSQNQMSPVTFVASCAPIVSKAAYAGDEVAYNILEETGKIIGKQLIALPDRKNIPKNLPVAIAGSAWKAHDVLFDTFCRTIRYRGFTGDIIIPSFEPIVGIIIRHYLKVHGKFDSADKKEFLKMYDKYTFKIK